MAVAHQLISVEDYLAQDAESNAKLEFYGGEILAMAGASPEHAKIVANVTAALVTRLRGRPCDVYTADLRVQATNSGYYYPDVVVACGKPVFADTRPETLLNPTVIVEVLSHSTEGFDRGAKWAHYRQIESLSAYLLVAQHAPVIEHYVRQPDGTWRYSVAETMTGLLDLPSLGIALPLAEVYDKVVFPLTSVLDL